jgi:DNA-binding transcriptional regulator YhcF (GntR family)
MAVGELPYTSRGKKVLELSMAAARQMGHQHVGTEHLLLGLIMEERSGAAQALVDAGITLDEARQTVLGRLDEARRPVQGWSRGSVEGVAPPSARGSGGHRDSVWFLEVDQDSPTPLYEQIVARLEEAVATGRLEPGERLPSVRDLAAEVGIAPGTVARAYSELEARGVVVTEGARGTRVASDPPAGKASSPDRSFLERLLRRPVVAAFHRGASAQQMREALDRAMQGILKML